MGSPGNEKYSQEEKKKKGILSMGFVGQVGLCLVKKLR